MLHPAEQPPAQPGEQGAEEQQIDADQQTQVKLMAPVSRHPVQGEHIGRQVHAGDAARWIGLEGDVPLAVTLVKQERLHPDQAPGRQRPQGIVHRQGAVLIGRHPDAGAEQLELGDRGVGVRSGGISGGRGVVVQQQAGQLVPGEGAAVGVKRAMSAAVAFRLPAGAMFRYQTGSAANLPSA